MFIAIESFIHTVIVRFYNIFNYVNNIFSGCIGQTYGRGRPRNWQCISINNLFGRFHGLLQILLLLKRIPVAAMPNLRSKTPKKRLPPFSKRILPILRHAGPLNDVFPFVQIGIHHRQFCNALEPGKRSVN